MNKRAPSFTHNREPRMALITPRVYITMLILFVTGLMVYMMFLQPSRHMKTATLQTVVVDSDNNEFTYYSYSHPFIFIGGHPMSGTSLMRAMLDSHSWVRCGEETRIILKILKMRERYLKNKNEMTRLEEAGIDINLFDSAFGAFMMQIIAKHGDPSKVLCNKDPILLYHGVYMSKVFPKAKWLFMMRDGRAVVHSLMTRNKTMNGYNLTDARQCLRFWNWRVGILDSKCQEIGPERCLIIYYEQLVLHPKKWMTIITEFLGLPWEDAVLHHQDFINKDGANGISVSVKESSSDQIVKPINWVGHYSEDILKDMAKIAPNLSKFGYDPNQNPPNYGVPDGQVANNTKNIQENRDFWEVRSKQLVAEMKKHSSLEK